MVVSSDSTFMTKTSGGGGGGSSSGGYVSPVVVTKPAVKYTSTGYLQTDSNGVVTNPVLISAADGLSSVYIGEGVQALDANGQPLAYINIQTTDNVPSSAFSFAGHAVECGPSGATFSPAIELTFQFTEEEWNNLEAGESFTVKWFDEEANVWVDIPTTVDPINHTVIGEITHFSTFAVFKQVIETPTSVVTPIPTETPVPTGTGGEGTQTGGFPWIWFIVVIVMIAVIGAGYYYMQQKK